MYLQNSLPTKGTTKIKFALWHDSIPSIECIRVFGSLACAYTPKQKRNKMDSITEQTILLGSVPGSKEYKIMNLKNR